MEIVEGGDTLFLEQTLLSSASSARIWHQGIARHTHKSMPRPQIMASFWTRSALQKALVGLFSGSSPEADDELQPMLPPSQCPPLERHSSSDAQLQSFSGI